MGIRSKRLMDYPKRQIFHGKVSMHTERCGIMRMDLSAVRSNIFLEAEGMQMAPLEVAKYFWT